MGELGLTSVRKDIRTMKLLTLILTVTVVAGQTLIGKPRRFSFRRPSWYIDDNVKDAAGCNSSWSSAAAVQTIQTPDHRIYIDTARHEGSTGDSRNVCVYTPPYVKRKLNTDGVKGNRKARLRFEEEEVPEKWILGKGTVGECGQGCCEWNPPKNITRWLFKKLKIRRSFQQTWYETTTDCEGEKPDDLITGPLLMKGQEGQRKSICVELCKKGEGEGCGKFGQINGNLRFCANHCCKLDDIDPIFMADERFLEETIVDPKPPVETPVDPKPPVDIKHGKRHKKHPKKGLDTVGEEKNLSEEFLLKHPKKKESMDEVPYDSTKQDYAGA